MIAITTTHNRQEADLMAAYIAAHGFHCRVAADDEGGYAPFLGAQTGYRIMINPVDEHEVNNLIQAYETELNDDDFAAMPSDQTTTGGNRDIILPHVPTKPRLRLFAFFMLFMMFGGVLAYLFDS
ncbi:MAG: hypothetical protein CMP10_14745 [Zetaproteobacteria bacterium]|nr:hypothetical protein [Pseudobdellovibrionaceae bacterium]